MVIKHVQKHCSGNTMTDPRGSSIRFQGSSAWANAQARCRKEKDCWGVYDSGCRKAYIYLCSVSKLKRYNFRLSTYALFMWFAWAWAWARVCV